MKVTLPVVLVFALCHTAAGQVVIDSLQQKINAASIPIPDSLQTPLPDTLLSSYYKVDSIRHHFNTRVDSLKKEYTTALQNIDQHVEQFNNDIDSLRRLDLPTHQYTQKIDSLSALRQQIETKFTSKLDDLKTKTTGKLQALDLPPEYAKPLNALTEKVNALNIKSDIPNLPAMKIPGYQMPEVDNVGTHIAAVGNVGELPAVPEMKTPVGNLNEVTNHAKGYGEDLKNITGGDLDKVEHLPETIEQQASKVDGIEELQQQSDAIEQHRAELEGLRDPQKAKDKAVDMAKKQAVDHFAGKEEQLKAAMEKMAKYKKKYTSVSSIRELPKRPPNPMKDKPFIERLVPGIFLQYQQKHFYLLDVNPYVGYKLTGRFTTGLGWNHRYAYDKDHRAFNARSRIFGPRGYVDFKLGKGFIAHLEGEAMNTFVPSTLRGNPDTGAREWVWGMMTGIKKEYKIYKNLKGTALIQYNLFNRHYKAPYVDRLNSRIGFEYGLRR